MSVYVYIVNFVGKGVLYLDCWGEILDFNSIFKKVKNNYVTRSTKKCPVGFTLTTSFNYKKSTRKVLSTFSFYR